MNLQELKDGLAKQIFENEEERERFDTATSHNYSCTCELCEEWWLKMGPEEE